MSKRECGDCNLCCKLLGVQSIKKPRATWCSHCTPGNGCQIHQSDQYPPECKTFECLWLQSQDNEIPDDWKPNKLRLVLSVTQTQDVIACYPDIGREDVLRRSDVKQTLDNLVARGFRVVSFEGKRGVRELHDATMTDRTPSRPISPGTPEAAHLKTMLLGSWAGVRLPAVPNDATPAPGTSTGASSEPPASSTPAEPTPP